MSWVFILLEAESLLTELLNKVYTGGAKVVLAEPEQRARYVAAGLVDKDGTPVNSANFQWMTSQVGAAGCVYLMFQCRLVLAAHSLYFDSV